MSRDQGRAGRRLAYFHLQAAAQRVRTIADQECLSRAGITAAQAGAMFVIARTPGANQRTLAEALQQRESAITGMVGRLSAAGLVERRPSQTDGRAWEIRLTAAGDRALRTLTAVLDTLNATIEEAIGAGGVDRFVDGLEQLEAVRPAVTRTDDVPDTRPSDPEHR